MTENVQEIKAQRVLSKSRSSSSVRHALGRLRHKERHSRPSASGRRVFLAERRTPCSELNPSALVESQRAQWMLSSVVSQPDSFRCFKIDCGGASVVRQGENF